MDCNVCGFHADKNCVDCGKEVCHKEITNCVCNKSVCNDCVGPKRCGLCQGAFCNNCQVTQCGEPTCDLIYHEKCAEPNPHFNYCVGCGYFI